MTELVVRTSECEARHPRSPGPSFSSAFGRISRLVALGSLVLLALSSRRSEGSLFRWRPKFPWTRRAIAIKYYEYGDAERIQPLVDVVCPNGGAIRAEFIPVRTVRAAFELTDDGTVLRYQHPSSWLRWFPPRRRPRAEELPEVLLKDVHENLARSAAAEIAYQYTDYMTHRTAASRPQFFQAYLSPTGIVRSGYFHDDSPPPVGGGWVDGLRAFFEALAAQNSGPRTRVFIALGDNSWPIVDKIEVHTGLQAEMLKLLPAALIPYGGMSAKAVMNRAKVFHSSREASYALPPNSPFGPAGRRFGPIPPLEP